MWDVAGYFYGRHVYPLARFSPIKSRRQVSSTDFAALLPRLTEAEVDALDLAG